MRNFTTGALFGAVISMLMSASVGAQEQDTHSSSRVRPSPFNVSPLPELAKYEHVERGKSLAQSLSLRQKLRGQLGEIADVLEGKLSASDVAILRSFDTQEPIHLAHVRSQLKEEREEMCSTRQGKDAVALEAAFTESIRVVSAESERYYKSILSSLSPAGQVLLLKHVDAMVSTGLLTHTRFDTAAFAREKPELAMQAVEAACSPRATPLTPQEPSKPDDAFGTVVR